VNVLAIDLGDKRTGLAVGDDQTGIVTPIDVVETSDPATRLDAIARLAQEHEAGALVVGLPLNMDDTEGPAAKAARAFAATLESKTSLPVHLFDERLSSYQADQHMARTGMTHKQKKRRRDALAAAVLLRDYLASRL